MAEAGVVDFGDQIHRTLRLLRERPGPARASCASATATSWSTSSRTRTTRSSRLLRLLAGDGGPTSPWWATTTRRSTAGAAPPPRTCWPSGSCTPARAGGADREPPLDPGRSWTRPRASSPTTTPIRLEVMAGIDKRLRSRAPAGPRRAPPALRHRLRRGRRRGGAGRGAAAQGFRPRDVAILVRSNDDADPFLRALNVKGIPHRFSGSRGLYAREEVRLLVAFLRVLASPDDSVSLFYLAASELYRLPEPDLLRLNQYARAQEAPAARGAARPAGRTTTWPASAAPPRGGARACSPTSTARRPTSPRLRTGEVLYKLPAGVGLSWRGLSREAERRGRGQGEEHRALLRDGEGLRRRGRARPRAGLRGAPRPAARGRRRPGGGRGRSGRGRRAAC